MAIGINKFGWVIFDKNLLVYVWNSKTENWTYEIELSQFGLICNFANSAQKYWIRN